MANGSAKKDFPLLRSITHLASASRGPLPKVALDEMLEILQGIYHSLDEEVVNRCRTSGERCRGLASKMLNCDEGEVALVYNTTHGINSLANGLDWKRGDAVLLPDIEYPANVVPWLRQRRLGVRVKVVPSSGGFIDLDRLCREIDDRTRLVAISHVEFSNGFKNDIRAISEIVHDHGGILFVDSAQSLGVVDTDVRKLGIDSLSACGYKWLCSPPGTGIFYIRKDLIGNIDPAYAGFESVDPDSYRTMFDGIRRDGWTAEFDYPLSHSANRFEFGESNLIPNAAFARSMEYLLDFGIGRIERRSGKIVNYLISRLDDEGYDLLTPGNQSMRAGIVTFRPESGRFDHVEISKSLRRRGILVSPRYGGIRASCHLFNDYSDVDVLLSNIEDVRPR